MQKVIVIVGPTAVGKSALAVRLARKFNGEVISADSRQVYKRLDIGTGKITKKEMRGVPHHLLDVADPKEQFSVSEYQKAARKKLEEIFRRGNLPIVVGGTGLYIQAIVNDVAFPEVPPNLKLRKRFEKKSTRELFEILQKLDARRAKTIDPHNPRRLIRAIEIARVLGKVPNLQPTTDPSNFVRTKFSRAGNRQQDTLWIGLMQPPEVLKKKIAICLFARIRKYLLEEVKKLHRKGVSWKRMEELGLQYRYISRHLRGLIARKEMIAKLQTEIWHYAKRQMVWFKRNKAIHWFNPKEARKIEDVVSAFLRRRYGARIPAWLNHSLGMIARPNYVWFRGL